MPVRVEVDADTETPVSAFLKLSRGEPHAFLLESVEGGERSARFSFLGARPAQVLRWKLGGRRRPHRRHPRGAVLATGQCGCRARRASPAAWWATSPTTWCGSSSRGSRSPVRTSSGSPTSCSWTSTRWWPSTTCATPCTSSRRCAATPATTPGRCTARAVARIRTPPAGPRPAAPGSRGRGAAVRSAVLAPRVAAQGLRGGGGAGQGVRHRRRLPADRDLPALRRGVHAPALRDLPGAAAGEPLAVPLLREGRRAGAGGVARPRPSSSWRTAR